MVKALKPPYVRKSKTSKIILKPNTRRASIRVPEKMLEEINHILEDEGKSSYQKGRWISQAIVELYEMEDFIELIQEEWMDRKNNIPLQITLTKEAEESLDKLVESAKEHGLTRKDIISATIRVAITNALIKEGNI